MTRRRGKDRAQGAARRVVLAATLAWRGGPPGSRASLARAVAAAGGTVLARRDGRQGRWEIDLAGTPQQLVAAVVGAARAAGRRPGGPSLAAIVVRPVRGARRPRAEAVAADLAARLAEQGLPRPRRVTTAPFPVDFRIHLDSDDLALARRVARKLGDARSGFPAVAARGERRADGGATVALHLRDPATTGLVTLYAATEILAKEAGADVRDSEIVGLLPAAALPDDAASEVRLRRFDPGGQLVERRLGNGHVVDGSRAARPGPARGGRAAG